MTSWLSHRFIFSINVNLLRFRFRLRLRLRLRLSFSWSFWLKCFNFLQIVQWNCKIIKRFFFRLLNKIILFLFLWFLMKNHIFKSLWSIGLNLINIFISITGIKLLFFVFILFFVKNWVIIFHRNWLFWIVNNFSWLLYRFVSLFLKNIWWIWVFKVSYRLMFKIRRRGWPCYWFNLWLFCWMKKIESINFRSLIVNIRIFGLFYFGFALASTFAFVLFSLFSLRSLLFKIFFLIIFSCFLS